MDYTDLKRRMEKGLRWDDDGWPVTGTGDDMQAAAAAIAALEAEVAIAQAVADRDRLVRAAAVSEAQRMRKAIRRALDEACADDMDGWYAELRAALTAS